MAAKHSGSLNPPPPRDPLKDKAHVYRGSDASGETVDEADLRTADHFAGEDEADRRSLSDEEAADFQGMAMEIFSIDRQLKAEGHSLGALLCKLAGSQFGVYPVPGVVYEDNAEIDD